VITAVDFVTVNVADQERAKRFYTGPLGLELLTDVPMGEPDGPKWIEVRPPGSPTKLVLFHAPEAAGSMAGFVLTTDDLVTTCERLESAGVEIVDKAAIAPWGSWWAQIRDSEGNSIGLTQSDNDTQGADETQGEGDE
jgi:predicted enzyme related to lactoylglutathione lyase